MKSAQYVTAAALVVLFSRSLGADLAVDAGLPSERLPVSNEQRKAEIAPLVQALREAAARKDWPAIEALCSKSFVRSAHQSGDAVAYYTRVLAPALQTSPTQHASFQVSPLYGDLSVSVIFWDPASDKHGKLKVWSLVLREEDGGWKFTRL